MEWTISVTIWNFHHTFGKYLGNYFKYSWNVGLKVTIFLKHFQTIWGKIWGNLCEIYSNLSIHFLYKKFIKNFRKFLMLFHNMRQQGLFGNITNGTKIKNIVGLSHFSNTPHIYRYWFRKIMILDSFWKHNSWIKNITEKFLRYLDYSTLLTCFHF